MSGEFISDCKNLPVDGGLQPPGAALRYRDKLHSAGRSARRRGGQTAGYRRDADGARTSCLKEERLRGRRFHAGGQLQAVAGASAVCFRATPGACVNQSDRRIRGVGGGRNEPLLRRVGGIRLQPRPGGRNRRSRSLRSARSMRSACLHPGETGTSRCRWSLRWIQGKWHLHRS